MKRFTHTFDSLDEMLQAAQSPGKRWCNLSHEVDQSFFGTRSWQHAVELATFGWHEGAEKLQQVIASMPHKPYTHPARDYDVAGCYPDVARACAGDPLNMVVFRAPESAQRPVVRLFIHCGFNHNVTTYAVENRGAAICSIIDAIEANGQAVELLGIWYAKSRDNTASVAIETLLKKAGEPLDIDRLAFVLMNASMHRRFAFALYELNPELPRYQWTTGYGQSADLATDEIPQGVVYFPRAMQDGYETPANARNTVKSHLEANGITIHF